MLAALDAGAERILIGCGDSGINDGGAGMAQALGARLLDEDGQDIGPGGAELARLRRIDLRGLDPRLARVALDAAVNWHNALLGPRGVARVFAPQKGATPEQVILLEAALENYAAVIHRDLGIAVADQAGSGASGGLGAGLHALLGAKLHPRYEIVMQYLNFDRLLAEADLVLTAEGSLDEQTPWGKIPAEVARRAKQHGLPVIALAGTLGKGAAVNLQHGIDAYASILQRPCSLEEAIAKAGRLLAKAAEEVMRMVQVGARLAPHPARRGVKTHPRAKAARCPWPISVETPQPNPRWSSCGRFLLNRANRIRHSAPDFAATPSRTPGPFPARPNRGRCLATVASTALASGEVAGGATTRRRR